MPSLPFENADQADTPDLQDVPPAQTAAVLPGRGGNFDNPDNPDNPEMTDVFRVVTTLGPSQTVTVPVGYQPDANAALTITPGTLDASDVFAAGAVTYGPYLAAATLAGVQYSLVAATSDPVSGAASIQPGDWAGGVFSPIGPALTGTLGAAQDLSDVAWTLGPPQTSVFDPASNTLVAGSDGFLHVLVRGTRNADGGAVDPSGNPVALAVTSGAASPADFQAADWLTVTAPPEAAGTYTRLAPSATDGSTLAPGVYRLTWQISGTTQMRVPGYVSVYN